MKKKGEEEKDEHKTNLPPLRSHDIRHYAPLYLSIDPDTKLTK